MKSFNDYLNESGEIGFVEEIVHSLAHVSGLPNAVASELVVFENGAIGQVFSLSNDIAKVLLFSKRPISVGTKATRTKRTLEIPAHDKLLGRIINPLGEAIDNEGPLSHGDRDLRPIDSTPLGIKFRSRINKPLETGVTFVDMMVPLGRGQRELVIGDRKTGKSNFLLKTTLTQAQQGVVCVFAMIGKRKTEIKKTHEFFRSHKVLDRIVIVASTSQDSAGMIFLTPYTAMAIAEYFRDQGKDVLIVLDDLTTHAKYYREISLLGKRFPGRNSYPGDIFYVHARLLERAGNFLVDNKESSITCAPVVESLQGDLTGYIQTNVMSMTDGHVFFDSDLFAKGRRPAINPFLSVTRVGRQTQTQLRQEINRELTSFFTLYEKIQNFVHFGAELSENIKLTLATGDRMLTFFSQTAFTAIPMNAQIVVFCMLWNGVWTHMTGEDMRKDMDELIDTYKKNPKLRSLMDNLVTSVPSFNELLSKVREQENNLLRFLGKKPAAPQSTAQSTPIAQPTTSPKPPPISKPKTKPRQRRGKPMKNMKRVVAKSLKANVKTKKAKKGAQKAGLRRVKKK